MSSRPSSGFTLLERSLVLVVIVLLVDGILAGRDLIHTAKFRATLSPIDKYNAA